MLYPIGVAGEVVVALEGPLDVVHLLAPFLLEVVAPLVEYSPLGVLDPLGVQPFCVLVVDQEVNRKYLKKRKIRCYYGISNSVLHNVTQNRDNMK